MQTPTPQSILALLAEHFGNPQMIWKAMAEYSVAISGSFALQTYRPDSWMPDESDIDLYIEPNGHCIVGFLKALQQDGAKIASPFDRLEHVVGEGKPYRVNRQEAQDMVYSWHKHYPEYESGTIHSILSVLEQLLDEISSTSSTRCLPGDPNSLIRLESNANPDYDHIPGLTIVRGETAKGTAFQLIFAPGKSVLQQVCRFHSSGVQSLVAPAGTFHMYGKTAGNNKAFWWRGNSLSSTGFRSSNDSDRNVMVRKKWEARGFTFVDLDQQGSSVRIITDDEALFALFDDDNIDDPSARRRKDVLQTFAWYQSQKGTEAMPPIGWSEPGPRTRSLPVNHFFHNARDVLTKYAAISPDTLRWCNPVDETLAS